MDAISPTELQARIQSYLAAGGLFNPEYMEHKKVRDLLLDILKFLDRPTSAVI